MPLKLYLVKWEAYLEIEPRTCPPQWNKGGLTRMDTNFIIFSIFWVQSSVFCVLLFHLSHFCTLPAISRTPFSVFHFAGGIRNWLWIGFVFKTPKTEKFAYYLVIKELMLIQLYLKLALFFQIILSSVSWVLFFLSYLSHFFTLPILSATLPAARRTLVLYAIRSTLFAV